ncbi:MAG TPA: helix-turn-helix domain-containing protein [Actinomycetales bacterium]|nr:helix-turn-helix domain-containing protein [Actinomycetales bacterium]
MIKREPGYGPSPVRGTSGEGPISGQRAAVLERLEQHHEPVRINDLAAEMGLHANTVRQHLEALAERGVVIRERAPSQGRGRPAWVFSAVPGASEPDPRVRDYAGLAIALSSHIVRACDDPAADALEAGRTWGRELAENTFGERRQMRGRDEGVGPRRSAVQLLDGLGFDPDADTQATTAALRRCPLLDAATRYPEVVCSVHLGIVRGALDVLGGDPEPTELIPFAEPGACRLNLAADAVGA